MAKHDTDPVLVRLVNSVNESGQVAVPVTVTTHGTVLTGTLIAQDSYFADLIKAHTVMGALQPSSGLLGKEYAKEVDAEAGYYLHLRTPAIPGGPDHAEGLWRISLAAVDAWTLRTTADTEGQDDRGPFARLLGTS
jgi:hypothetical protein